MKLNHPDPGSDHRIVIFDLGEVLATPPALYDSLAARLTQDAAAVAAAYWMHRDDYDRGGEGNVFWTAVLEKLGIPASADALEDLTRIDTEAWTTIRPDAAALLENLHSAGVRVGILSNATIDMARAARQTPWARWVSDWFFSSELGVAKPDPAIYRCVSDALGLPAGSIVFVDDRPVNVEAARKAGWNAWVWTSGSDTATLLMDLGLIDAG